MMSKVDKRVVEKFEMFLERKFAPAANSINDWRSASRFVDNMMARIFDSTYYKNGARKISDLIKERYGKIDWMLMDVNVPLVLEVGPKNQFEIMRNKHDQLMYRFVPSGY
ncbi:hypothetical protein MERCI_88 [Klebsiella phage vB_KaeM_Merci]|nr:hypothetical protein MERCI_88 [Klebsiella phage vB_KaeM_Merci]